MNRSRIPQRPIACLRFVAGGLMALAIAHGVHAESPDPARVIVEATRVTAIDVMVAIDNGGARAWLTGNDHAQQIEPDALRVRFDGEDRPVISVAVARDESAQGDRGWHSVIWLDAGLTDARDLHFAATEMGTQAEALTAIGTVEVVVADPEPRQVLAATRDTALLGATLGQIALRPPSTDNALVTLRHDFRATLPELASMPPDETVTPRALARAAAAEEKRLVQRHLDTVLLWLTDQEGVASNPRRALFVANGGFDLDPDAFYDGHLEPATKTTDETATESDSAEMPARTPLGTDTQPGALEVATERLAQTLAAYGWVTIPIKAPAPPPPPEGVYLGKWFFPKIRLRNLRGKEVEYVHADPDTGTVEKYGAIVLPIIAGTYQASRDPDKAAAFIELGEALRGQDKLEEAAEAFEKAIYHYYNDRRTTADQAAAWAQLGATYAALDNQAGARAAFHRAIDLDPTLEAKDTPYSARLTDPLAPLARVATATAGRVALGTGALAAAVDSLASRARVTFQVAGPPTGALVPLDITAARTGVRIRAPAWARSATPESLAALRVRRLLAGAVGRGPLDVRASGRTTTDHASAGGAGGASRVRLSAHLARSPQLWRDDPTRDVWLRVTIGVGGPERFDGPTGLDENQTVAVPAIDHRSPVRLPSDVRDEWRFTDDLTWPDDALWMVILVEDLDSGLWGADVLERGDLAP